MIDHDFVGRFYTFKYFEILNLLQSLGGFNASLGPMFSLFIPLVILNFLFQLAKLINWKHQENYSKQLSELHHDYKQVFEKINIDACEDLDNEHKQFLKQFALQSESKLLDGSDEDIIKNIVRLNKIAEILSDKITSKQNSETQDNSFRKNE